MITSFYRSRRWKSTHLDNVLGTRNENGKFTYSPADEK
jgi:hypothetical protein